ncbi:MAG TPA: hypothetical protein VFM44_08130 [Gemmatimonadota bacterium]|nr:hypothetical protein [Gemmatimonadota bacterium]
MRPGRWIFVALLAAGFLGSASTPAALAQGLTGKRIGVNPYVGVLLFDDGELQEIGREANVGPVLGARLNVGVGRSWQFDVGYGYAQVETELSEFTDFPDPEDQIELDVHSIYGAADYFIGGSQEIPTRLLLSAGLGFMIVNPDEGDGDASFMIPLAVGFTHPVNDWITFRGDVRDHLQFCSEAESEGDFAPCIGDEMLNHFEVSGGLEFWLWPRSR